MNKRKCVILFICSALIIFSLSACSLFKDPDDFDTPPEPAPVTTDNDIDNLVNSNNDDSSGNNLDLEEAYKEFKKSIKNIPNYGSGNQELEELEKQISEMFKNLPTKPEEVETKDSGEVPVETKDEKEPEVIEEKKDDEVKTDVNDVKDEKEVTNQPAQTVTTNKNDKSFIDNSRWADTMQEAIPVGEGGKVIAQRAEVYEDFTTSELSNYEVGMRFVRRLTKEEAKKVVTERNEYLLTSKIPTNNPEAQLQGFLVEFDTKNYPTKGPTTYFNHPIGSVHTAEDSAVFYKDGKMVGYMNSFAFLNKEAQEKFVQGDIIQYYIIYQTPVGYDEPVYYKVTNIVGNKVEPHKVTYFKLQ